MKKITRPGDFLYPPWLFTGVKVTGFFKKAIKTKVK
jgi:hypothetical protein